MREAVWRTWFNKDHSRLEQMNPAEAIAINPNEENWERRDETVGQAGGKI